MAAESCADLEDLFSRNGPSFSYCRLAARQMDFVHPLGYYGPRPQTIETAQLWAFLGQKNDRAGWLINPGGPATCKLLPSELQTLVRVA